MPFFSRLVNYHPLDVVRASRRFWDHDPFAPLARELNALMEFPRWTINPRITAELNEQSHIDKEGFHVKMDIQQFEPNEITVKTADNMIVIEGKHEERPDEHGIISRHFVRKYSLPEGVDLKRIASTLSSDGILTIKAPFPDEVLEKRKERLINIERTGPARLKYEGKSDEAKKDDEKKE